jgi:hypothetical protein
VIFAPGVFYNGYRSPIYWTGPGIVYIEQADQTYWYYCQSADVYYPYVTECASGWMLVLPPPH